jgi:biotin carboxylase
VTPSRLADDVQQGIRREVAGICVAAGLTDGPVHAEVRVNGGGIWALEIAARSIGGLCGRVLTDVLGLSLEELILRQALGEPRAVEGDGRAAGVMMIPTPRRGIYHGTEGVHAAQALPGISGLAITAQKGQIVAPPPDGASYLGFIFSRAASPAEAEQALRAAHQLLQFDILPEYPAMLATR